jgi:hypothetical protein
MFLVKYFCKVGSAGKRPRLVGVFRKPYNLFNVRVRKGAIDNIGNLSPSGDFHNLSSEKSHWERGGPAQVPIAPCNIDQGVVRRAAKRRLLKRTTPKWAVARSVALGQASRISLCCRSRWSSAEVAQT